MTDIMKHKFSGFCMAIGCNPTFLETILKTGNVKSLAIVGPPP